MIIKIAQRVQALMTLVSQKGRVSDELLIKRLFSLTDNTLSAPAAEIILQKNLLGIDFFS